MCISLVCLAFISLETKNKFPLNSGKGEKENFCDGDFCDADSHWDDHKQGWLPAGMVTQLQPKNELPAAPSLAQPHRGATGHGTEGAAMGKERPTPFHKLLT